MEAKVKVYQHTFKDGHKIALRVDMSGEKIVCQSVPAISPKHLYPEYKLWRDTVVLPDVINHASPSQIKIMIMMAAIANANA